MQEFFLQVKPSARIFFFFFLDKYCFVCHLLIKKNYFTKELMYMYMYFVGFNNNKRPFFNNYIKDLKSNVMYCLLFSDCFLFTIHFLTAIHIECFINVGVKVVLWSKFRFPVSLQLLKIEVINTYHAKFYIEIPTGRPVILIVKFSFALPPLLDSKTGREPHGELDPVARRGMWRHTLRQHGALSNGRSLWNKPLLFISVA